VQRETDRKERASMKEMERGREREKEPERSRERGIDISGHTQQNDEQKMGKLIDRHTDTQKCRHAGTQRNRHAGTRTNRHTYTQTDRHKDMQTHRHTDTQTDGRLTERTAVLSPSLETQKNR